MRTRVRTAERGQALPIAVATLAIGAILITPLLTGAGTGSKATNLVGIQTKQRYSLEAGIEWSGWRLLSDPRLTTDTLFTTTPLLPLPATVNGTAFPATALRFIPGAGAVEGQSPAWQGGGGDQCYAFSASDAGTLSARITVDSGQVWVAVLPAIAPCIRPLGLPPLPGSLSFGVDVPLLTAGDYKLLVGVNTATSGTVELSVPAATYEVRATTGSRSLIARLVAGYAGLRVLSWQHN
jgi:hypothetical protein